MGNQLLLDTNILSHLVRDPHGIVAKRIAAVGEQNIFTSIIVAAELRFGAAKRDSPRLTRQLEVILSAVEIFSLVEPADRHYAALRSYLEKQGEPIGPNDMLIAAQALSLGAAVVTANVSEFTKVPGLAVENWLE